MKLYLTATQRGFFTPLTITQVPCHKAQNLKVSCKRRRHVGVLWFVLWQTLKTPLSFKFKNYTHIYTYACTHVHFHTFFLCSSDPMVKKFWGKKRSFFSFLCLSSFSYYSGSDPKSAEIQGSIRWEDISSQRKLNRFFCPLSNFLLSSMK